jgi:L-ascorbate metabolism protein UlaG (beta-lactamase superfamily)
VTHGHYDHQDNATLKALARRFGPELPFVVPLGMGAALPRAVGTVQELDWWHGVRLGALDCTLVPAQHWHRRLLWDTNRVLWGGYVVRGTRSLYHSGDTGYFDGFRTIGRVFPDLDVAVLPLGAYEPRWFMGGQHMPPEASVRAWQDVGARWMLGMHWGTFDLTDEPYQHGPFELLPQALRDDGLGSEQVAVLEHGGVLSFGGEAADRVAARCSGPPRRS